MTLEKLTEELNQIKNTSIDILKIEELKEKIIKEKQKQYYKDNKEQILIKKKKYNEENKEKIKERKRLYRIKNKEKIQEYRKMYYEKHFKCK